MFSESNKSVTTRKRPIKYEVDSESDDEDIPEMSSNKTTVTTRKRKIKAENGSDEEYIPERPSNKKSPTTRKRKIKVEVESDENIPEIPSNKKAAPTRKRKIKVEKTEPASNHEDIPDISANSKKLKTYDDMQPGCSKWAINSKSKLLEPTWTEFELLSEYKNIDPKISQNITRLLDEGNTIPFIARYRRNVTGNMSPEMLRDIKECYEEVTHLKSKIKTVVTSVEKCGKLTESLNRTIVSAKTLEELEHIYAPFKPGSKRTLAERAKELGLEDAALKLLYNKQKIFLQTLVDVNNKDLNSELLVEKGIIHIIASLIATDTEVLSHVRKLRSESNFTMETKKSNTKLDKDKTETKDKKKVKKEVDESKYENYFNYQIPVKYIKPHQVLAINRGESQKILSVKVNVPDGLFKNFQYFCVGKFINQGPFDENRKRILNECIKDSYTRFIQPLIIREVRADLKVKAEKASYEVFCTNLKHLLLAPPLKGKPILGIDPGFSNGCKVALISKTGSLLSHTVIYPNIKKTKGEETLKSFLLKFDCELIALGNGTACRETETWLTNLIKNNYFAPLTVSYTIVAEDGASIYSCSPEAKKEFPDLDPNIISAVSLARRIQEPLAELVKVEPQHLGVGMYQHDLKKKRLEEALNEVVSECVSFVGVDLNTTSQCLLRKIAGLSDKRATCIIEHREEHGPFVCRKQLLEVKGIGKKVFEQCAGFLRVGPIDANDAINFYKNSNTTKLDSTYIHPESYEIALKILKKLDMNPNDIGNLSFISTIKSIKPSLDIESFSREIGCDEGTANLILDALSKPLNHDLRIELNKTPIFRKSLTSIADISVGTVLTGKVKNVTHFGCFVDIGVGKDGLIHSRAMNGFSLQIGDRVEVEIINLDRSKLRIGLKTLRKL